MSITRFALSGFIACALFALTSVAFADNHGERLPQDTDLTPEQQPAFDADIAAWSGNQPADTGVACFDYYTFQSVQVSAGPNATTYTQNQLVEFTGTLHNQNPYPVVDGNVLVRINKKNPEYKTDGHFVIDEFYAEENIALPAGGTQDIAFSWLIPEGTPAGDYTVDYFFSVGKRFNLGGLPFTHDITIGGSSFTVEGGTQGYLSFEPSQTMVDGEKYTHVGSAPVFDIGDTVTITHVLSNTTLTTQETTITHELFFWDSLRVEDLRDTSIETRSIPAQTSQDITYTIPAFSDSVSFLKTTAQAGNHKSITWVRLGSNTKHPRLNYPALTQFPLTKGDTATLFTCFHNTSGETAKGKVEVTLTDKANKEVASLTYEGAIPGAMSAAKEDFTTTKDYDYLTLNAKLYNTAGALLEEYTTTYDCAELECRDKNGNVIKSAETNTGLQIIIIAALVSALLIVGIIFVQNRKK